VEERVLIERAKQGDELAWRWLYEAHKTQVYTVVRRLSGDDHAADDLSQEVWLRVFTKLALFEFRSSFKTWVTKVATNVAYDSFRPQRMEDETAIPEWTGDRLPDDALTDVLALQQQLDRLPSGYRTVLVLRAEGFSHEEIAATLGIDAGTSRSQYHKGLAQLRRRLGEGNA